MRVRLAKEDINSNYKVSLSTILNTKRQNILKIFLCINYLISTVDLL